MIEISHLTKKYETHVAVDDLNLTIEPGRIYGFLGPNGAGKSTTMNMITGYLGATEGIIKINGFVFGTAGGCKEMYWLFAGAATFIHGYDGGRISFVCSRT